MQMPCHWCQAKYKGKRPSNFGDDPNCAFDEWGAFQSENWQCAGLDELREAVYDNAHYSEDQHLGVVPYDGGFIILSYYKNRGRTEGAWIVEESNIRLLTAADLKAWEQWKQSV